MTGAAVATTQAATEPDARGAPRTYLLLSASIITDGLSSPVRIRNLSETGALLEGGAFPNVGQTLTLARLKMQIKAEVVWKSGCRCGIKFDGLVSTTEWIAGVSGTSPTPALTLVAPARAASGVSLPTTSTTKDLSDFAADLNNRLAEEVAFVRRLLESAGEALADDTVVLQRHGVTLQGFDRASQILQHVSTLLASTDPVATVGAIGMPDLRARLLRKSLFKM